MATPYPAHLMIEITDRCNLKCMICVREEYEEGIGSPGTLINFEEVKKLEEPIRRASIITLTGFGESFLHPRLKEMLDYIYSVNPSDNLIKIVTNGTALSEEKASWFSGHLHTMSVSLNASHSVSYAREMHPYEFKDGRDVTSKFERLVSKIGRFSGGLKVEERKKVHLHYVVHRDNIADLGDFVRLTHKMGLSVVQFTHLMVHRAEHIERSIYWIKDHYNDAIDEAIEVGQSLGVAVGARKFFTEPQKQFVAERDCTWPHDTAIVGSTGSVIPCCYWGVGNVGNAFTDPEGGFDKIWFGDYYKKLREKRTGPACATCNILRIFDDITIHFSPYLKSQSLFVEKLANFQEMTTSEGLRLNNDFDRAGLDMALHRWTLRNSIGDFKCLLDVRVDDADPLGSIEDSLWKHFRRSDVPAKTSVTVDLSGRFVGLGWGPAGRNQHGQSWRWLGGHRGHASIFLRLKPGVSYCAEFLVHSAVTSGALENIEVKVNGAETGFRRLYQRDGRYFFSCIVSADVLRESEGYAWVSIITGNSDKLTGQLELALTSLQLQESEEVITSEDIRQQKCFDQVGLDITLYHRALAAVNADRNRLIEVQVDNIDSLRSVEQMIWQRFQQNKVQRPDIAIDLDLPSRFLGFGWGPADRNQHGQAWRWLGGHGGPSSVFVHLRKGSSYSIEFLVHSATTTEGLKCIKMIANGVEADSQRLENRDGRYYFCCSVSADAVDRSNGYVWLSISTGNPARQIVGKLELSLTSLCIREAGDMNLGEGAPPDARPLEQGQPALYSLRAAANAISGAITAMIGR
jgi:MoaA/NifB/PqqE/SkfB family radical SAM enzyme